jgi:hypothetical protein
LPELEGKVEQLLERLVTAQDERAVRSA